MKKLILTLASVVLSLTAFAGTHHIYVDNQSGWENVALYAYAEGRNDLLGGWPGMSPASGTVEIDGVNYLDFEIDDTKFAAYFIFNNGGSQTNQLWLPTARDYYLTATTSELSQKSGETYHLYLNDQSGFGDNLWVYAYGDREVFGDWGNQKKSPDATEEIDAVSYKVYNMPLYKGETTFHVILSNEGADDGTRILFDDITKARDYYVNVTSEGATQVEETYHLYLNDQSGFGDNLWVYAYGDREVFGDWGNQKKSPDATEEIDAVSYKVYNMPLYKGETTFHVIFSNAGADDGTRKLFDVTKARDYYVNVTSGGATQVDETYHLYINDQTGWNPFWVYAWGDREAFGNWDNQKKTPDATTTIGSVEYKVYNMPVYKNEATPTYHLIFSQEGSTTVRTTFNVSEARDYYLNVTTTGVSEVGETFYTIYINNQTDWATPALFAYEGEANPLGGWPGTVSAETETVDEVEYIKYSIPESAFPCKLIFNNGIIGEGSAQLADYELTNADDYYLIAAESGLRLASEPAPVLNTYRLYVRDLTGWETFDVYAYGTPNAALGGWPGKTVTDAAQQEIDGVIYNVYEYQIYSNVTPEIYLIFHNNVGEGLEGDYRQYFTITEARDYDITVSSIAAWEGKSGVKRFRPYIPMEHVFGYSWPNENGNPWPGAELTPDEDGWYSYIVTKGNNVIFNNGTSEGAMQTGDLAYTDDDPVADECAVWQGETSVSEGKTYMTTTADCDAAIALRYERDVTNGNYGTICLPYSAIKVAGAELFSIAGRDASGIYLDEASELLMGVPYIFLANANELTVYYMDGQSFTPSDDHLYTANGLVGFINDGQEYTVEADDNNYILHDNGLYYVDSTVKIVSNRAYIDWSYVPSNMTPSSAPRRRIGINKVPTGIEQVPSDKVQCTKVIENGVLYMMYNGTMYNVQGQIVK